MLALKYYIKHPAKLLASLLMAYGSFIPDELYLQLLFRLKMGYWPNLKDPKTFNEKLQWLKLYDRRPDYTQMVDKVEAKKYVANIIGEEYIIPTLGVWDLPEEVDWDSLPQQFVLKTTHGGGSDGVIICKDKNTLNIPQTIEKLEKAMKRDVYKRLREWPYKNVSKRIIAEEYMEDKKTGELRDYKFFVFNGKVRALFIATERGGGNVKFDFYDSSFNHLNLVQTHPMSGKLYERPLCFDEMKQVAETLSKGLPQVRVDLYEINGAVYFGEYTFFHHGGIVPFHPYKYDIEFGSWIDLNIVKWGEFIQL